MPIHSNDAVFLGTRGNKYLKCPRGTGQGARNITDLINLSPNHIADPGNSDEMWWIERVAGAGPISHGDMVFLRTRAARYLNAPAAVGPRVKPAPQRSSDPNTSDEIWWIERVQGTGSIESNDLVFFRSRANKYLNAPSGVGPHAMMSPNHSTDLTTSDEIWRILLSPAQICSNYTFDPIYTSSERNQLLSRYQFAFNRITTCPHLSDSQKRDLLSTYTQSIHHDISIDPDEYAHTFLNARKIWVNIGLLLPRGDNEIAQTLIHEMMHCAGFDHPEKVDADSPFDGKPYFNSPPLQAEICIAGSQSLTGDGGKHFVCSKHQGQCSYRAKG